MPVLPLLSRVCKGVVKAVIKKDLAFDSYKKTLFTGETKKVTMNVIRSHKQTNHTESITKVGLDPHDSKRLALPNGISTLPYGHWQVTKNGFYITPEMAPEYLRRGH